jgi:hypothetical protein
MRERMKKGERAEYVVNSELYDTKEGQNLVLPVSNIVSTTSHGIKKSKSYANGEDPVIVAHLIRKAEVRRDSG